MPSTKEKKGSTRAPIPEITENLEKAAYFHWQARGCPVGDPMTDWLEVEKAIKSQSGKKSGASPAIAGSRGRS